MPQTCAQKKWYEDNKERLLAKAAEYRKINSDRIKKYQANVSTEKRKQYKKSQKHNSSVYIQEYRSRNKDRIAQYTREYNSRSERQTETIRLRGRLRKRMLRAIESNAKGGSAIKDLGCSIEFLKTYLESKFTVGMSWDNWGHKGWHIDHIRPLVSFDLTVHEQVKQACHYTNLQPLWAIDNLKKSGKYNAE